MKNGRSKYNVAVNTQKRTYNGITFDSEIEMRFYRDVVLPQYENGTIVKYELQKKYILQPSFKRNGKTQQPITYIADFYLLYDDGAQKVIDIKGMPDEKAKLKRKMFFYVFPEIDYEWISYSAIDGGFIPYEELKKQRMLRKKLKEKKE